MTKLLLLVLSCLLIHSALGSTNRVNLIMKNNNNSDSVFIQLFSCINDYCAFILQDESSILIRMVGKRTPMKTGCNGLQDTGCMDSRPIIIKKLGFQTFPKLVAHLEERKHDGVDLQSVDKFRNSFLIKRLVPMSYLAVL